MTQEANEPLETSEGPTTPLPERVPVMPVKSTVLFPTGATGLQVGFAPNVELLSRNRDRNLAVVMVHSMEDDMPIEPATLEKVGVLSRILNRLNLPGGTVQTTIQGLIRVRLDDVVLEDGCYWARAHLVEEIPVDEAEAEQKIEQILTTLGGIGANVERLADVPRILRSNLGDPGRFADLVATLAHFNNEDKDEVLQRLDVRARLDFVARRLAAEWEHLRGQREGDDGAPPDRRPAPDHAADIRRRIARLQAELGEIDPSEKETIETLRRIDKMALPGRVAAIARAEAERLRTLPPASDESSEIRSYLEALLCLPWTPRGKARFDPKKVQEVLDRRHLGLEEVKRRILEFVSVAKLRRNVRGPIPCIVGPPDVGKRSLAAAIAEGLGRPLVRLELGGRGESQLVGRRKGRNGASMGKLMEGYREAGVADPVYLLEEMDLIGLGNVEGDPVDALEEALDPETRDEFVDRYLDTPFDLSHTVFIATASDFYRIPRSLRDFLIEIRIAGYTAEEKVDIALQHILPEMAEEHGLKPSDIHATPEEMLHLTRAYARDSGLGNLRRALGSVLRYAAYQKAQGIAKTWEINRDLVETVLGVPRYPTTEAESSSEVGVVTGLAWTASGGELMFIEALKMPGTGRLIITGLLGEVMRESVSAAYSYVRSRAEMLGIPTETFPDHDLHIHFPVGATPKDGPSAGAAVTLAIASSLSDRPVRHDVAMTGEVTLRGKILDIGGVKEKILAAYRAGIRHVILPSGNERDLRDVPADVSEGMHFHFVDRMEDVFRIALLDAQATADGAGQARAPGNGKREKSRRGKKEKVAAEGQAARDAGPSPES